MSFSKVSMTSETSDLLSPTEGLHLALGGGSARGLAHLGILKAFQDHQIPIASISGTSMGSLVGASFALLGNSDDVIYHFQEHVRSDQFNHARYTFLKQVTRSKREEKGFNLGLGLKKGFLLGQSYTKGSVVSFEEFLREVNALIPNKTFNTTKIPFFATSVDLLKTREVAFNQGYLRSAVMASSAIPGLFPPIVSDETIYVDGGWMNKIPITPLLHHGAKNTLAINVSNTELPDLNPRRGTHLMRMADMAAQVRLQQLQVRHASLVWQPDLNELDLMDFDQVERAVEVGYAFAKANLDQAKALLNPPNAPTLRQKLCGWLCKGYPMPQSRDYGLDFRGIWDVKPLL